MKFIKIFLILALVTVFYSCEFNNNPASTSSVKVNRKVLVELSTNVNCVNCPPAGHFIDLVDTAIANVTSSDTNVIVMALHSNLFPADPFYWFNPPVNSYKYRFYRTQSNPSGYLNGSMMPMFSYATWVNSINLALAENETQDLSFTNTFDSIAGTGTVNVNISQLSGSAPADLLLHAAILESKMYYGSGTNSEKWFNNILRDLITDTTGLNISLPYSGNINYTLKSGIIARNASMVLFTQSPSTKEVYVVRKKKLM